MPRFPSIFLALLLASLVLAIPSPAGADPVKVELSQRDGQWQLLRGGKPFTIKGVGGSGDKSLLVKVGGNSFRTWGVGKDTQAILDEAHKLGLTVTLGIWLGHERHGFDYSNVDQVAAQMRQIREAVLAYRDHPALLMWSLGNEMEGFAAGDNAAIWSHLQAAAAMVRKLDPNHPIMTVVAELGGARVKAIHSLCPDIDIVGINTYAGVVSIPQRYRDAGGTKPYVVTEFGPPGVWEVGKTSWGAAPEPTSTQKAAMYRKAYDTLAADRELCLGSYAFTWGHKQEATATWYGMLLPDGSRTGAVDALQEAWTGKAPANRCPVVEPLKLEGSPRVKPGATITLKLTASDPDGDKLSVDWLLAADPKDHAEGGDQQAAPPTFPKAVTEATADSATFTMPSDGGAYRVFVVVRDGQGGAATANLPLFVDGATTSTAMTTKDTRSGGQSMPFRIDNDPAPYIPSGYMGDTGAIAMNMESKIEPKVGDTCIEVSFAKSDGWGGVVWQHPADDWGDKDGGYNLSGARQLTFYARGDRGGEKVKFGFGILGSDKTFPDTGKGELADVTLTSEWKQYAIKLEGKDLGRIKTGFYWVLSGQGKPVRFYLDDIRYE